MKVSTLSALILASFVFLNCSDLRSQDKKYLLSAGQFAGAIVSDPGVVILDVRTPEEYAQGHIDKSVNYDWNGDSFFDQIAGLRKKDPVYVYCYSGGRSGEAAAAMRKKGFSRVYELQGGIMKWRAAGLPEVTVNTAGGSEGMTREEFSGMLNTDKVVLVDFYADWCGPCKKMKPFLDQISAERKDVIILRINVDSNRSLANQMGIEALPTLHVYKNKKLTWNNVGFVSRQVIESHLD